jgi:uncharacterized protein
MAIKGQKKTKFAFDEWRQARCRQLRSQDARALLSPSWRNYDVLLRIAGKESHMHPLNMRSTKIPPPSAWVALLAAIVLSISPLSAQTVPGRTLNIVGNADVHAAPDAGLVSIGVVSESDTAAAALKANSAALAKAIDAVRSFGLEPRDLQTGGLSLEPRYYRPDKPSATDRPRIIGYTAANEVTLRVRDLAKLGDLLDRVTVAGANRIDGIQFIVSNQGELLDEARRKAVADAKDKAELYARAAGLTLGKVMSLTEESVPSAPRPLARAMAAAAPVPVEAGEMTLSMKVRVVWSLVD